MSEKKVTKYHGQRKNLKTAASCYQDVLTVLWHVKGAIRLEYVFICTTVKDVAF
jgi:hypothetical protein